jgi:hypothetical protein
MNDVSVKFSKLGTKVEPFWLELPVLLTEQQIGGALKGVSSEAKLPDGTDFSFPVAKLFSIVPAQQDGKLGVQATPDGDALHAAAVLWCQKLTTLPYKSLPRSQRPIINLLKRLPPEPTGNPAIDRGRKMVLDNTVKSLWVPITSAISAYLRAAAQNAANQPQGSTSV